MSTKSRNWCFTLNNYSAFTVDQLKNFNLFDCDENVENVPANHQTVGLSEDVEGEAEAFDVEEDARSAQQTPGEGETEFSQWEGLLDEESLSSQLSQETISVEDLIDLSKTKYLCVGIEVGASGTPHLQGVMIMKNQVRLSTMKGILDLAHWEVMKGTPQQAITYCKKEGDWFERGKKPVSKKKQGEDEKQRWRDVIDLCKRGKLDELAEEHPGTYMQHYRTVKQIKADFMTQAVDLDGTCGVWIWGPPGSGKSRKARREYPNAYMKMYNKWWDGYQGEDNVILDEMEQDGKMFGHYLKIWGDRYAFVAEVKGSGMSIRPKKLVITSNYSIQEVFKEAEIRGAIERRFEQIYLGPEIEPFVPPIDFTCMFD